MKKILSFVFLLLCCSSVFAQQFDSYFTDATLRIDYIFAGNSKQQWIALDQLNRIPRWYGKRQHLAELPVEGNGQITVRDHRTGAIVYRNSFSTLSRSGSPIRRPRRRHDPLRTYSSSPIRRIRSM